MSGTRDLEVVTLASSLIQVRGEADIPAVKRALEDAKWLLAPAPSNANYKEWQSRNGMVPTTPEQDQARKEAAKERARDRISRLRFNP